MTAFEEAVLARLAGIEAALQSLAQIEARRLELEASGLEHVEVVGDAMSFDKIVPRTLDDAEVPGG